MHDNPDPEFDVAEKVNFFLDTLSSIHELDEPLLLFVQNIPVEMLSTVVPKLMRQASDVELPSRNDIKKALEKSKTTLYEKQALFAIACAYRRVREKEEAEYHGFYGVGKSRTAKLQAVDALVEFMLYNTPIPQKHMPALTQNRSLLGAIYQSYKMFLNPEPSGLRLETQLPQSSRHPASYTSWPKFSDDKKIQMDIAILQCFLKENRARWGQTSSEKSQYFSELLRTITEKENPTADDLKNWIREAALLAHHQQHPKRDKLLSFGAASEATSWKAWKTLRFHSDEAVHGFEGTLQKNAEYRKIEINGTIVENFEEYRTQKRVISKIE